MLDTSGEVIGVVTSVIVEGFGLAIAANTVKLYLDQRLVDGEVITGWVLLLQVRMPCQGVLWLKGYALPPGVIGTPPGKFREQ